MVSFQPAKEIVARWIGFSFVRILLLALRLGRTAISPFLDQGKSFIHVMQQVLGFQRAPHDSRAQKNHQLDLAGGFVLFVEQPFQSRDVSENRRFSQGVRHQFLDDAAQDQRLSVLRG